MAWLELTQKVAASIFILLTGFLLLFWCLPEGYFFRDYLHKNWSGLICRLGLDNYWALFAPQPVSKNFLVGFELEFADGTVRPWKLPEFTINDDGYQATPRLRYVKMHNQWLSQKDIAPKVAICRFVLQKFQEQERAGQVPVRVHIIRYYEPPVLIPDIPWLSQRAYTYEIDTD